MSESESPAADEKMIGLLVSRDGIETRVRLIDGQVLRVYNIAWGYDEGDRFAHITTNLSPFLEDQSIDFFFTSEVDIILSEDDESLWPAD